MSILFNPIELRDFIGDLICFRVFEFVKITLENTRVTVNAYILSERKYNNILY